VVAAGVSLLHRQERVRAELLSSVLVAEEEAEREGCVSGDDMVHALGHGLRRNTARPREADKSLAASAVGLAFADRFAVAVADAAELVARRRCWGAEDSNCCLSGSASGP
jgi:hypothetical protein